MLDGKRACDLGKRTAEPPASWIGRGHALAPPAVENAHRMIIPAGRLANGLQLFEPEPSEQTAGFLRRRGGGGCGRFEAGKLPCHLLLKLIPQTLETLNDRRHRGFDITLQDGVDHLAKIDPKIGIALAVRDRKFAGNPDQQLMHHQTLGDERRRGPPAPAR